MHTQTCTCVYKTYIHTVTHAHTLCTCMHTPKHIYPYICMCGYRYMYTHVAHDIHIQAQIHYIYLHVHAHGQSYLCCLSHAVFLSSPLTRSSFRVLTVPKSSTLSSRVLFMPHGHRRSFLTPSRLLAWTVSSSIKDLDLPHFSSTSPPHLTLRNNSLSFEDNNLSYVDLGIPCVRCPSQSCVPWAYPLFFFNQEF